MMMMIIIVIIVLRYGPSTFHIYFQYEYKIVIRAKLFKNWDLLKNIEEEHVYTFNKEIIIFWNLRILNEIKSFKSSIAKGNNEVYEISLN